MQMMIDEENKTEYKERSKSNTGRTYDINAVTFAVDTLFDMLRKFYKKSKKNTEI